VVLVVNSFMAWLKAGDRFWVAVKMRQSGEA